MERVEKDPKGHQKLSSILHWAKHSCSHLQECLKWDFVNSYQFRAAKQKYLRFILGELGREAQRKIFSCRYAKKNPKFETAKYQISQNEGKFLGRNSALPAPQSGFGFPGALCSWRQGAKEGPHLSEFTQLLNHGNMDWFWLGGTLKDI